MLAKTRGPICNREYEQKTFVDSLLQSFLTASVYLFEDGVSVGVTQGAPASSDELIRGKLHRDYEQKAFVESLLQIKNPLRIHQASSISSRASAPAAKKP